MAEENSRDELLGESNYIILKGRFKSKTNNLYGLTLITFSPEADIESFNTVVSTFSTVFDMEPHIGWERYEETILDLKWKGNFNSSMTSALMDHFKGVSKDEAMNRQIFESVYNYDYDSVEIFLTDILYRVVHDKNLVLEIGIQEVEKAEYLASKEKKQALAKSPASATGKGLNIEEGSVILPLQPILAPVKGKPLYELKIGDKIVSKILPNSDRENYFIDLLDLRVEGHIKPVAGEVIDIKANSRSDPLEILVQLAPGIYGKIIEDERQVKIRIYDPQIDGPMSKKSISDVQISRATPPETPKEKSGLPQMTYITIALFILVVIIFGVLMYISF